MPRCSRGPALTAALAVCVIGVCIVLSVVIQTADIHQPAQYDPMTRVCALMCNQSIFLRTVQLRQLYPDSKTLVDLPLLDEPEVRVERRLGKVKLGKGVGRGLGVCRDLTGPPVLFHF
jgi:hypothetical protein